MRSVVVDVGAAALSKRGWGILSRPAHARWLAVALVSVAWLACSNDKRAKDPAPPSSPAVAVGQGGDGAGAGGTAGGDGTAAGGMAGAGGGTAAGGMAAAGGRSSASGQGGASGSAACRSDGDCKIAADYCTSCLCRPLGPGESVPPCSGPGVRCFADPCLNKKAACVSGRCVAADAGKPAYDPCAGKSCGDTCRLCAPNDTDCAETAVVKQCDSAGKCVSGDPGCRAR